MRKLLKDVYLGLRAPLLNCAGRLFRAAPPPESLSRPRKILFIRIDRIGDVVLSLPAIRAVKEKYPSAEVCVLAGPVTAPLLACEPGVGRVLIWNPSRGLRKALGTVIGLRKESFDLAIDPCADHTLKTAVLAFASGAKLRAGYEAYGRGIFFNLRASLPRERGHFVEEAFGVLRLLGIGRDGREPQLHVGDGARAEASAFLKERGVDDKDFLAAVHPGGYYPSQRWSPGGFAEVLRGLMARRGAKILLIGSGAERGLVEGIAARASAGPDKKNIIEVIDPGTDVLSALIGKCRVFIGNNSGPLHLAAALGVPSVSTMGPTDPVRWSPLGPDQLVLKGSAPCGPCLSGSPGAHECMKDITAEMVLSAVERILGRL
ncbi:MAG: glycosyltransferase family 9 protein [Elusimicrobiales bacterium]